MGTKQHRETLYPAHWFSQGWVPEGQSTKVTRLLTSRIVLAPVFTPPPPPWSFPISQPVLLPTLAPGPRSSCFRARARDGLQLAPPTAAVPAKRPVSHVGATSQGFVPQGSQANPVLPPTPPSSLQGCPGENPTHSSWWTAEICFSLTTMMRKVHVCSHTRTVQRGWRCSRI